MVLALQHFPLDYGPINIYAIIADKYDDRSSTAKLIKQFFSVAVDENAGRACRGQKPLTYTECATIWSTLLPTYGKNKILVHSPLSLGPGCAKYSF